MRLRRGNYSIIFVLTSAVMLSYLAFSIDGGRVKVAMVQAENAAEAASVAALMAIRDGGSRQDAEAAARAAANKIQLRRFGKNDNGNEEDFEVTIDWGQWNWDDGRTAIDSRWEGNSNFSQAITVNVSILGGGVSNIFGPAIALVGGKNSASRRVDQRDVSNDFSSFAVTNGARAAMRNRDIMVVLDVSRRNEPNIADIQAGLADFLEELDTNRVPGDQIGLVAYAGDGFMYDLSDPTSLSVSGASVDVDALGGINGRVSSMLEPAFGLFPVGENTATLRTTLESVESCNIGSDVFYRVARHTPPTFDPERTAGAFGGVENWFNFYALSASYALDPQGDGPNTTLYGGLGGIRPVGPTFLVEERDAALAMLNASANSIAREYSPLRNDQCAIRCMNEVTGFDDPVTGLLNPECGPDRDHAGFFTCLLQRDGGELSEEAQCAAWRTLHLWFLRFDGRRDRLNTTAVGSPLACHDGNWWEGSADEDRYRRGAPIPNMPCLPLGEVAPVLQADRAFYMAGSRPGRGLFRAFESLAARGTNGEPTVVLITNSRPRCGEDVSVDGTIASICADEVQEEAAGALTALRNLKANVYVIGVAPSDEDEAVLSAWDGIGRGYYTSVEQARSVRSVLRDISDDLRIQVVQ